MPKREINVNKESMSWLSLYALEMKETKETSAQLREYGKELKYSRIFQRHVYGRILKFLKSLKQKDIKELDHDDVYQFNRLILQRAWSANRHGEILLAVKRFLQWLKEKGVIENDFADVWRIPPGLRSPKRRYPAVSVEMLEKIRFYEFRGKNAIRNNAIIAIIFEGFREEEVSVFRWRYFPIKYFDNFDEVLFLSDVWRKGGGLWNALILDKYNWDRIKNLWLSLDNPLLGGHDERYCFLNSNGGNLTTMSISKIFQEARDSVFYDPEYRDSRKLITPHLIRHIWAQEWGVKNQFLGADIGAPLGGWLPGSKVYRDTYLRTRDRFVANIAEAKRRGLLRNAWGNQK